MNAIKERKDVETENRWKVEDIFKSEDEWKQSMDSMVESATKLSKYKGKLNNGKELLEFLNKYESLSVVVHNVMGYASLCSDADTTNSHYQKLVNSSQSAAVKVSTSLSFANVEIMGISDESLNEYYKSIDGLLKYKRYLTNLRRSKKHILSDKEELILSASGDLTTSVYNAYSILVNADMKFEDAKDASGNFHPLTASTFINLLESSDQTLRKSAYSNYYKIYGQMKNTIACLLNGQNKNLKFNSEMRKFNSPIEASLHDTNVPVDVYHNLINTVHSRLGSLHKYMALRKKILGLDEMHMYDLYVPLLSELDVKIPYSEAVDNVLEATKILGNEYHDALSKGFNSRWIDRYENKGKRSGAYSSGMPVHPFVLMNYGDNLNTEFTLAHEMGHAMHSYFSNKYQSYIDHDYVIFVAEVASTCNEALLMDYLRNKTDDPKTKAYLINYFLEQFRTTVYRQTMFAEFELKISELIMNNVPLTADILSKEYKEINKLYYGDNVVVDDEIALEWSRIPHFYYDFYVFQYATGFSAAMALSKKILKNEGTVVEDYLSFLKGGCSKTPIDLLKGAGVDMSSPKPIEEALDLFDSLIDELDQLLS